MKQIPVGDKFALVDEDDFWFLRRFHWGLDSGYALMVKGTHKVERTYMHRLIMMASKEFQVDHKNGNKLDNQKLNLRTCTDTQNKHNQKKRSHSKWPYKGICPNKKRWAARIGANGIHTHIGTYDTPEEAAIAYDKAAIAKHGEFALTNFPLENYIQITDARDAIYFTTFRWPA